ncbi:MAG: SMI1/KNR4 family protein [Anaerotruncus sp.]|nr:SMI1/KNR4 family protein [Anaerotruncus sp.]
MGVKELVQQIEQIYFNQRVDVLWEPIEDDTIADYQAVEGASDILLDAFEQQLEIKLPASMRELYRYKNGSEMLEIFCLDEEAFRLMSLEEILQTKEYFQDRDLLWEEVGDLYDPDELKNLDERIQPYLFHKRWIPFATLGNALYLMLDYAPAPKGKQGQIILYVHDPDFIYYIAEDIEPVLSESLEEIREICTSPQ